VYHGTSGDTLYFVRFDSENNVYLSDGSSVETWGDSGHDANNYDVSMTEVAAPHIAGSAHFGGNFDASNNITTAGTYRIEIFRQDGASPADTDTLLDTQYYTWDGSAEITPYTLWLDLRRRRGPWI
jgi:hypothetical protein